MHGQLHYIVLSWQLFQKFKFMLANKACKVRQGRITVSYNFYMHLLDHSMFCPMSGFFQGLRAGSLWQCCWSGLGWFYSGSSRSLDDKLGHLCINYFFRGSITENEQRGSGLWIEIQSLRCQVSDHLYPVALFSIFCIFLVDHFDHHVRKPSILS